MSAQLIATTPSANNRLAALCMLDGSIHPAQLAAAQRGQAAFRCLAHVAACAARVQNERGRVTRCLDDIRMAKGLRVKRRTGRPVRYPMSAGHAAYVAKSAASWLPLARAAHRGALADLRIARVLAGLGEDA